MISQVLAVSRVALRLWISLCQIEGRPPLAQDRACSTENLFQQAQVQDISVGVQPYLRARASSKALLWRANQCSDNGRAVSQIEDPFFFAKFTTRCSKSGKSS